MIGRILDRYRIEAKLGQGGMGVVYKARDTQLDRVVAIKVLPPEMVASPERKQRFVQEARAASALNHPNIVTVYDVRADDGVDFIVMEYVEGRTLDQTIVSRGLEVTRSLRYAAQIADALARAHEAGIVHRDLKPSNVIVTPADRVKVLDFGVAKLLDPGSDTAETATRGVPITDAGMAVGTAAYMSPEQAEGKKIDARSDIFSFGAVLYQMITGRRAFAGDSHVGTLSKVLNEEPAAPGTFITGLSPDVERTILRCLRKDPARRFQTMADLKVAIDDLVTDSSATVPTQPAVSRPAQPWRWVWAIVIPSAIAVAYFRWSLRQQPTAPATPMRSVPLTAVPGIKRFPSFSPDGNHVTFTWTGLDRKNQDVYVQQIGAGDPLRLTFAEAADSAPVWSPDGRSIAFLRQTPQVQELRLIAPLGGPERKLTEIRPRGYLRAVTMAWCPDSSCLIVTDGQGGDQADALFVVSTQGGEKRQLMTPPAGAFADNDPAVSPDGKWLAFRRDVAPFSGRLHLVALGNDMTVRGEPRPVTSVLLTAYGPKWISNDEILFFAKGALWRMRTAVGSQPERLPVGRRRVDACRFAAVPGRDDAPRVRAQLCGLQHLAHRHGVTRRAAGLTTGCSDRLDAARFGCAPLAGWEATRVHLGSCGRVGSLGGGCDGGQRRPTDDAGCESGISAMVARRTDNRFSQQCRRSTHRRRVPRRGGRRQGAQSHPARRQRRLRLVFARRAVGVLQLAADRRAVHLEDPGVGW